MWNQVSSFLVFSLGLHPNLITCSCIYASAPPKVRCWWKVLVWQLQNNVLPFLVSQFLLHPTPRLEQTNSWLSYLRSESEGQLFKYTIHWAEFLQWIQNGAFLFLHKKGWCSFDIKLISIPDRSRHPVFWWPPIKVFFCMIELPGLFKDRVFLL